MEITQQYDIYLAARKTTQIKTEYGIYVVILNIKLGNTSFNLT
jgi:hypothetical protein